MPSGGGAMERDAVYWARRVTEERVAAIHAAHPRARDAHLAMSATYEERLNALAASEQKAPLRLVDVA